MRDWLEKRFMFKETTPHQEHAGDYSLERMKNVLWVVLLRWSLKHEIRQDMKGLAEEPDLSTEVTPGVPCLRPFSPKQI
jgi:hypothetical protein